jgi:dynein heavy chain
MDPKNLGFKPYYEKWSNSRPSKNETEILMTLFGRYLKPLVEYVLDGVLNGTLVEPLHTIIPITGLNMTTQLCTMLQIILPEGLLKTSGGESIFEK